MIWMTQPGVTLLRSDCEIDNILDGRIFMMQVVMLSQRWLVFVATKFQGRASASRTKRFSLTKELLTVLVNSRKDLGSKEKPPVLLSACLGMDFFSFHMLGRSFGLEQTCPYWRSVRESQLGTWSQPSRWASTWFGTVFQQGRTPQQRKHWRQRFWWGAPASRLGLIWVTVSDHSSAKDCHSCRKASDSWLNKLWGRIVKQLKSDFEAYESDPNGNAP